MNHYISKVRHKRRGQTLIEALLALSVITVSFMGIMTLLSKSFFYDRVTSDQLTGTYLASEGIELAKSFIDHGTFDANWGECFPQSGEYQIDYTMTTCGEATEDPVGATPQLLYFDPMAHSYSYQDPADATQSIFSRIIQVEYKNTASAGDPPVYDEITVVSIVSWSTGPISQSIQLEDHFYNWRK